MHHQQPETAREFSRTRAVLESLLLAANWYTSLNSGQLLGPHATTTV